MTSTLIPDSPPLRSTFISALAWIFIVLAGFATLIAILQNIAINLIFPAAEMHGALDQAKEVGDMPWFAEFMFRNIRWFFLGFLVLSATTLVSAIGLLKRRNWARIAFAGLMGFGVLWNIAGIVLMFAFLSSMPKPAQAPPDFAANFDLMSNLMMGFNLLMGVGMTVLFGWILRRLLSPDIRREFGIA